MFLSRFLHILDGIMLMHVEIDRFLNTTMRFIMFGPFFAHHDTLALFLHRFRPKLNAKCRICWILL